MTIELDWIEEYQYVDLSRLLEAVSGKGWDQKWSDFQLDSLFSPKPCTKVIGEKQDGSLLFLYPAFWLAQMDLFLYSGPALCWRQNSSVKLENGCILCFVLLPFHRSNNLLAILVMGRHFDCYVTGGTILCGNFGRRLVGVFCLGPNICWVLVGEPFYGPFHTLRACQAILLVWLKVKSACSFQVRPR